MRNTKRRDTPAELALRSVLHGQGLRYRVDHRPLPDLNRRADLVFYRVKVAVFVDGCFWHGCVEHKRPPVANAAWWVEKIERNRSRDRETNDLLISAEWLPVRVWEHEPVELAAQRVTQAVRTRSEEPRSLLE